MKQPDQWSRYAERILASGERPHFAPEPETLALHAREIAGARALVGPSTHALVLGATPELADLALEQGCRVTRMDCNPAMFDAATKRQRPMSRVGETRVVGDWLDMPGIADGSVDLVLGDASLNNVAHAQMAQLIRQLHRITRPGSVLSLRQLTLLDNATTLHPIARTVQRYRAGNLDAHVFGKLLRFCCFIDEVYEGEQRLLDARRVFQCIERCHREGVMNDAEHAFMRGRRSEIQHTMYRPEQQQAWFAQLGLCRVEHACPPSDYRHLFDVWVTRRA
ncbi:MAG: class I SAM-dependent methyltransferase [Pseudomonadota bacterium]